MSKFITQIAALFLIVAYDAPLSAAQRSATDVAAQIKSTFDSRLSELQPETQYHYALRMYRVTGDSIYIPPIAGMIPTIRKQMRDDLDSLSNSTYLTLRRVMLLKDLGENNRKSRARNELFRSRGNLIVDLAILSNCYKLMDHSSRDVVNDSLLSRAVAYLKSVDFTVLASDSRIVSDYSAQAANAIYYLYFLGIADLREEYLILFRRVFPDIVDRRLSGLEFNDKIYGLTHLILAASQYYQQPVDSHEFDWILRYFESRSRRILSNTKPDIIAEVGICYLLAGEKDNSMVRACREAILKQFDSRTHLIPSPSGDKNLETGEHRNVLAYILFAWPKNLRAGPTWPSGYGTTLH